MNIKGQITFLFSENGASLEIYDKEASVTFVKIELNAEQVLQAFSRLAYVPCEIKVANLECVGKKMLCRRMEFEMPEHNYHNRREIAFAEAKRVCPEGWEPDNYFDSQDSFFSKNSIQYAQTGIRRWE